MPRIADDKPRKRGPDNIAIDQAATNLQKAIEAMLEAKNHTGDSKIKLMAEATGKISWGKRHLEEAVEYAMHD